MIRSSNETHLQTFRYGDYTLTNAIRPGVGVPVVPCQGYRIDSFRDPLSRVRIPLLTAAVTSERLMDVFVEMIEHLGDMVHVVLESSHAAEADYHFDLERSHIDKPILLSHLYDFEDMLLHDGCAGIAVLSSGRKAEIQLDEHKQINIYARNLKPFRHILREHGIRCINDLKFLSEAEHIHHSLPSYEEDFRQLCCRLSAGDMDGVLSDEGEWSC